MPFSPFLVASLLSGGAQGYNTGLLTAQQRGDVLSDQAAKQDQWQQQFALSQQEEQDRVANEAAQRALQEKMQAGLFTHEDATNAGLYSHQDLLEAQREAAGLAATKAEQAGSLENWKAEQAAKLLSDPNFADRFGGSTDAAYQAFSLAPLNSMLGTAANPNPFPVPGTHTPGDTHFVPAPPPVFTPPAQGAADSLISPFGPSAGTGVSNFLSKYPLDESQGMPSLPSARPAGAGSPALPGVSSYQDAGSTVPVYQPTMNFRKEQSELGYTQAQIENMHANVAATKAGQALEQQKFNESKRQFEERMSSDASDSTEKAKEFYASLNQNEKQFITKTNMDKTQADLFDQAERLRIQEEKLKLDALRGSGGAVTPDAKKYANLQKQSIMKQASVVQKTINDLTTGNKALGTTGLNDMQTYWQTGFNPLTGKTFRNDDEKTAYYDNIAAQRRMIEEKKVQYQDLLNQAAEQDKILNAKTQAVPKTLQSAPTGGRGGRSYRGGFDRTGANFTEPVEPDAQPAVPIAPEQFNSFLGRQEGKYSCAKAAGEMLDSFGITNYPHTEVAADFVAGLTRPRGWVRVDAANTRPGDVVSWYSSSAPSKTHVEIADGTGGSVGSPGSTAKPAYTINRRGKLPAGAVAYRYVGRSGGTQASTYRGSVGGINYTATINN